MPRIYVADRLLHFGSLLFMVAWTLAAFAALAAFGVSRGEGVLGWLLQFVHWLMPVLGVYLTWTHLTMPHSITVTADHVLHFESVLTRFSVPADQVSKVRRDRLGWFLILDAGPHRVRMVARINGLWSLLKDIHDGNPRVEIEGL